MNKYKDMWFTVQGDHVHDGAEKAQDKRSYGRPALITSQECNNIDLIHKKKF